MLHEKMKEASSTSGKKASSTSGKRSRKSRRRSRSTYNDEKSFTDCRNSMKSATGRSSEYEEGAMVTKDGHVVSKNSMKNARFKAAFDYSPKFSEKPMFNFTKDQPDKIPR